MFQRNDLFLQLRRVRRLHGSNLRGSVPSTRIRGAKTHVIFRKRKRFYWFISGTS